MSVAYLNIIEIIHKENINKKYGLESLTRGIRKAVWLEKESKLILKQMGKLNKTKIIVKG